MQWRRPSRRSLFALLSTIVFIWFLPEIFAFVSHIIYGNPVQVGKATILIPSKWVIYKRGGTLAAAHFTRIRFDMDAFADFNQSTLSIKRPGAAFPHDKWKEVWTKDMIEPGFIFQRERKPSFGDREGYCLEFSALKDSEQWRIFCEIPPLEFNVLFMGKQSFVEQFYAILQQAKFTSPTKSPTSASPRARVKLNEEHNII